MRSVKKRYVSYVAALGGNVSQRLSFLSALRVYLVMLCDVT